MEVEQERVGQLPDVAEPLFGARALHACRPRLPRRADDAGDEHRERHGGSADDGAIAAHEFRRPVAPGVLPRDDRQAGEVPAHVLGELIHRRIPPPRLLAERLEDDVVEVAGKLPAQTIGVDGHPAVGFRRRRGPCSGSLRVSASPSGGSDRCW